MKKNKKKKQIRKSPKFSQPKIAYKFMSKFYLEKLESDKKIYINHLNNYKEETYGSEIGDDSEGEMINEFTVDKYVMNSSNKRTAFEEAAGMDKIFGPGLNIIMKDVGFVQRFNDKNYYNYCVCLENDINVKNEFGGTTLVINDFPKFLYLLNKRMRKLGMKLVVKSECSYIENRKNLYNQYSATYEYPFPALVKALRYSYQKEYRILWERADGQIIKEPIEIYCPEAIELCTFVY